MKLSGVFWNMNIWMPEFYLKCANCQNFIGPYNSVSKAQRGNLEDRESLCSTHTKHPEIGR